VQEQLASPFLFFILHNFLKIPPETFGCSPEFSVFFFEFFLFLFFFLGFLTFSQAKRGFVAIETQ